MKVKTSWTLPDFYDMDWHDSHIYSISFPLDRQDFCLEIDYIFKWNESSKTDRYSFWVSPCRVTFFNILHLKINLNFNDNIGLNINSITKHNQRSSPNGQAVISDFIIECDLGVIQFESTGFLQEVLNQPILSTSQKLQRDV